MKFSTSLATFCLFAISLPCLVSATWFGNGSHKETGPVLNEHVQQGPDVMTIHSELPIPTVYVERPVTYTATVTATVTAVETAVETATKTLTDIKTVHAVQTVLPKVDEYKIGRNETPKQISESDELVHRRVTDILVPKAAYTQNRYRNETVTKSGAPATFMTIGTSALTALTGVLLTACAVL